MAYIVANSGESISAKFDGALRMTYANDQDYIVDNIGSEFAMTYNSSSLQVSVGTGVANICGRGIMAEESNSLTLTANATTYLCLRIDLTQTQGQEGMLYANTTSTIATDNLNNVNGQHDMLLAVVTTDSNGVTNLVDRRNIRSKASIAYTLPTASSSTLGGIKVGSNLSISNGVLSGAYSTASTSANGLMSASDKSKLNGIANNANNYSLPTASSSTLGGVKVGGNLSISSGTLTYKTCGIDTNNVLGSYTAETTITASQDCWCIAAGVGYPAYVVIDGVYAVNTGSISGEKTTAPIFVKAGQTITFGPSNPAGSTPKPSKLYGVKY